MTQPTFTLQEIAERLNPMPRLGDNGFDQLAVQKHGYLMHLADIAKAFGFAKPNYESDHPFTVPQQQPAEGET